MNNNKLTIYGSDATILQAGADQTIVAKDGNNYVDASSGTIKFGGSADNTVQIANAETTALLTIKGVVASDNIYSTTSLIEGSQTKITGGEQFTFTDGQVLDILGTAKAIEAAVHWTA